MLAPILCLFWCRRLYGTVTSPPGARGFSVVLLRIPSIPLFPWCTNPHNPHEFGYPVGSVCRENHSFPPVKRHGAGSSPAPWRLGSKIIFPAHSVSLWSSSESLAFIHSLSVSTRMSLGLCAEGKIGSPLPHTTPVPVAKKRN